MGLFVKFKSCNENFINSLSRKEIFFSTVDQFNDFNDMNYMAHWTMDDNGDYAKTELINELKKSPCIKDKILNVAQAGTYPKSYLKEFEKRIKSCSPENIDALKDDDLQLIEEALAFLSVGVFSVSSIKVFCDDAAQVMFGHYGNSLKGIALIYEINNSTLMEVDYGVDKGLLCGICSYDFSQINMENYSTCKACALKIKSLHDKMTEKNREARRKPGSGGLAERLKDWRKNNFKDVADFLIKSEKWSYEDEWRIFSSSGLQPAKNHEIKLKAILYTSRIEDENLEKIKNIISEQYSNEGIIVQEISVSHSKYEFIIYDKNNQKKNVKEWLESELSPIK